MVKKAVFEQIFPRQDSHVQCIWTPRQSGFWNPAYHKEYEIHYIKSGEGSYFIGNRNFPFAKNNLVIIKSGQTHTLIPGNSFIEKGSLYFSPSFLQKNSCLAAILEKAPATVALLEKEATLFEIFMKNIGAETEAGQDNWQEIVSSQVVALIYMIQRYASRERMPARQHPSTEKIILFLDKHYRDDLSLGAIAENFSMSVSHLSHTFKHDTGLSVKHYILHRRIIEAKKLLTKNTELKVTAVGFRVGFKDFSLFNHNFKKITGLTPTNYRNIARHKDQADSSARPAP